MTAAAFALRPYQEALARRAAALLRERRVCYLAMEMRVGKTHVALRACSLLGARRVACLTRKLARASILRDHAAGGYEFSLDVVNYESAHKLDPEAEWDALILDEAHSLGSFPRPSLRARRARELMQRCRHMLLLSGTPSPESYSQLYHQLWPAGEASPFAQWKTFYEWARSGFVELRQINIGSRLITDYSGASRDLVMRYAQPVMITFTQRQAKFRAQPLRDEIILLPMEPAMRCMIDDLLRDRYYRFRDHDEVVCDTAVKLQSKIHQVCSGTVITESGQARVLTRQKAEYLLAARKRGLRIAVFYLYAEEGSVLEDVLPRTTRVPEIFQRRKDMIFISQFQSGSRGICLSEADVIAFYNIHFSSELYQQARQRASEQQRVKPLSLWWLFTEGGIEQHVYQAVQEKQDYTLEYFKEDFDL